MRMRDALTGLVKSLGWEAESDTASGLVSQLSRMVDVSDGQISVKEPPTYVAKIGRVGFPRIGDAIAVAKGRTVRLVADLDEGIYVPSNARLTLDLNGHTITTDGVAIDNLGDVKVSGGTVESTASFAVCSRSGAKTTLTNLTIRSVEGAVITGKAVGTKVMASGCDMYASDNAVVAGNGSEGFGGNTVVVRNSRLTGGITSAGYVACGVYCPNDDSFEIDGCDVMVTGGCGVLSRAGRVLVRNTSISTTGATTGKVGDSRVVVPCSALVFDEEAAYPSLSDDDSVRAYGCVLASEVDAVAVIGGGERIEVG